VINRLDDGDVTCLKAMCSDARLSARLSLPHACRQRTLDSVGDWAPSLTVHGRKLSHFAGCVVICRSLDTPSVRLIYVVN